LSSNGNKNPQVTTDTKQPWSESIPYLKGVFPDAQELYQHDVGFNPWMGQTQADISPQTTDALNFTEGMARSGSPLIGNTYGFTNDTIANQGLNGGLFGVAGGLNGMAGGQDGISTGPMFQDAFGRAWNGNSGLNNFYGSMTNDGGGLGNYTNQFDNMAGNAYGMNSDAINWASGVGSGHYKILTGPEYQRAAQDTETRNTDALGTFGQFSNGGLGIGTEGDYRGLLDRALGRSSAETNLSEMAAGKEQDNPYLQQMLDAMSHKIGNQVNSSVMGAGRTGSAAHTDVLTRGLTEAEAPVLGQAYESAKQRQMAANSQIDAARQAGTQLGLGAVGGITNVRAQDLANRMAGAQNLVNTRQGDMAQRLAALQGQTGVEGANISNMLAGSGLLGNLRNQNWQNEMSARGASLGTVSQGIANRFQGASGLAGQDAQSLAQSLSAASGLSNIQNQNLQTRMGGYNALANLYGSGLNRAGQFAQMAPGVQDFQYDPARRLGTIGDFYDQRSQGDLNSLIDRYNAAEARPWEQLSRYNGILGGLGAMGGTTVGTRPNTSPALWQQLLGGGLLGATTLSKLGLV
jgi:hypothetical protein